MSTSQIEEDQPSGWRKLYRKRVPYGVRNFVRQGIILAPYHVRRLVRRGVHAMTGSTRVLRSLFDRPTRGLLPDGSVHADAMTELIRKSGYFDDKFYALADEARSKHIDPISHYVTEGEKRGFAPSEQFDPVFYKDAYPDVAAYSFVNALHHYLSYGKAEGGGGFRCPSLIN